MQEKRIVQHLEPQLQFTPLLPMASLDDGYQITGKVCPPKLPMDSLPIEDWSSMLSSFVESVFTETPVQNKRETSLLPCCALSSQANVLLSSENLSHSSVIHLPYLFCNFCDFHTDSKSSMLYHVGERHIFKCNLCDFIAITRWNLVQHQLSKHLDAEEMKPIISSLAVNLNISQLHRNLQHITQSTDLADSTRRENLEPPESVSSIECDESVSQTELLKTGIAANCSGVNILNRDKNNRTLNRKEENRISEQLKRKKENTFIGKDQYKRLRIVGLNKGDNTETSHISFHQMPHFLDDSDSAVTSSSSNSYSGISQEDEKKCSSQCNNEKDQNETNENRCSCSVPSFLTEPLVSPTSAEQTNLATVNQVDSPVSSQLELENCQWYEKDDDAANSGLGAAVNNMIRAGSPEALQMSPIKPNHTLLCSNGDLNRTTSDGNRSLSPNLSILSGEKLQKQFEEVVSKSPGFSFLDCTSTSTQSLTVAEHLKGKVEIPVIINEAGCLETHTSFSNTKQYDDKHKGNINQENEVRQTCENFFMSSRKGLGLGTIAETEESPIPANNCVVYNGNKADAEKKVREEDKTQHKKTEGYDLLRRLLLRRTIDETVSSNEIANKNFGAVESFSKEFSNEQQSVSVKDSKLVNQNHDKAANVKKIGLSDMTLRELLTQDFQTTSRQSQTTESNSKEGPIFLVCGYCNFESSSRSDFKRHISGCNYTTKVCDSNSQDRVLDSVKSEPDKEQVEVTVIKEEHTGDTGANIVSREESASETADTFSTGHFSASEVLKGLSYQYLDTRGNNGSSEAEKLCNVFQEKSDCMTEDHQDIDFHGRGSKLSIPQFGSDANFGLYKSSQKTKEILQPYAVVSEGNNEEKIDNILESDSNCSQDSSDPDYNPNVISNMKKKGSKRGRRLICQKKKRPLARGQATLTRHQPHIHLSCLHCSFSSNNRTNMRQHLVQDHPHSVPFAKALFIPQKTVLLYFCKGANSKCTFLSNEPVEILEHIKLCYSGHLDSFIRNDHAPDYSQVLLSVGVAWKILDPTPVTYYCLRCSFSKTNLQKVAYHVSINHAKDVAGILLINQILTETRVRMLCLVCGTHVLVKMWASHPCRQLSKSETKSATSADTDDTQVISTFEVKARLSHTLKSRKSEQGDDCNGELEKVNAVCELMEAENKNNQGASKKSKADQGFTEKSYIDASKICELKSEISSEIVVKEAIVDIDSSDEETADNVPVHFPSNTLEIGNSHPAPDANRKQSNENVQTVKRDFSSIQTEKECSGYNSVLQNLLTAPKVTDNNVKKYSLLQNLLKSAQTVKEKELSHSSPALSPQASVTNPTNKRQKKNFSIHKNCSPETQSKKLSEISTSNAGSQPFASPVNPESQSQSQTEHGSLKRFVTRSATKQPSKLHAALTAHQSSSQLGQSVSVSTLMTSPSASAKSNITPTLPEPSPPLIPLPPSLPLLPPLSPSPPTAGIAEVTPKENQVSPAPFTNLLRGLLSKSQHCPNP